MKLGGKPPIFCIRVAHEVERDLRDKAVEGHRLDHDVRRDGEASEQRCYRHPAVTHRHAIGDVFRQLDGRRVWPRQEFRQRECPRLPAGTDFEHRLAGASEPRQKHGKKPENQGPRSDRTSPSPIHSCTSRRQGRGPVRAPSQAHDHNRSAVSGNRSALYGQITINASGESAMRSPAIALALTIVAACAGTAFAQQPLTRADCDKAGMKWHDSANVCGGGEAAAAAAAGGAAKAMPEKEKREKGGKKVVVKKVKKSDGTTVTTRKKVTGGHHHHHHGKKEQ